MRDLVRQHFEAVRARRPVCTLAEEDIRRTGEGTGVDGSGEDVGFGAGMDPNGGQVRTVRTLETLASHGIDACAAATRGRDPAGYDAIALHSTGGATEHGSNGRVAELALKREDRRRPVLREARYVESARCGGRHREARRTRTGWRVCEGAHPLPL